jgi:hypothetical protein
MAYTRTIAPRMFDCEKCGKPAECEVFRRCGESLGYRCDECSKPLVRGLSEREYPDWQPGNFKPWRYRATREQRVRSPRP